MKKALTWFMDEIDRATPGKENAMKTLCDLDKKEIEKNLREIMKIVNRPEYVCRKCARAANKEEHICKPVRIAGRG